MRTPADIVHSAYAHIKEMMTREEHDAPVVKLNPEVKDFYNFTLNDLTIENYKTGEAVKNIPVAV